MKKNILVFFLSFFLAGYALAAPPVGQPAPDFTATDNRGVFHTLADYEGKIVVLEWTNRDCPYVKKHYGVGSMQALQKEAADAGVVWLSVVSSGPGMQGYETPADADRVAAETGSNAAARLLDPDGALGHLYGATATPHMFVIDRTGTLVYKGAIDDMPSADPATLGNANNYVQSVLADLAAARPVAVPETQAYGCSVKYGKK